MRRNGLILAGGAAPAWMAFACGKGPATDPAPADNRPARPAPAAGAADGRDCRGGGERLWAIVPPPAKLLQGPSDDSRRLSQPALAAGFNFFANENGSDGRPLQEAFVAAVAQIARRFGADPAILGYEAFNEPVVLKQ